MEIKLITENNFDSQYKEYPAVVFYSKDELQESLGYVPSNDLCIIDFFKLIDAGKVAIYSDIENKFVNEINKEIHNNDFEIRVRYYFPDGIRFVDIKTGCRTP